MQRAQPYCGENSEPGRYSTESLTSNPRVREHTRLRQRIDAAKKSILVAVWSINVPTKKNPNSMYDALKAAEARGVEIRLVTDAHKAKKRNYGSLDVVKAHMPTKKGIMHHKFMVTDAEYVVTGSANFVTKSFSGNDENIVAIKSLVMASSFTNQWEAMVKAVR